MAADLDVDGIREQIHRALRVARVVDPDDGTVPFFKADEFLVWTSPGLVVDTILNSVVLPLVEHLAGEGQV